jgi:hypothetical protein
MLLLRAGLLELLVCFHVVGAAVLFRRLSPRESPWLAFIVPTLIVMAVLNFIEHFIALPSLGWLLPFTLGGLLWAMARPGYSWEGLRLPSILFLVVFTWVFFIRCLNPSITCNTEGVADMARVLDFCLGSKLPPVDTWCPPYDHGGYYTFQHYGASLLTRLFTLDIGTGYNMGFTLLNTFVMFVGAGAAYYISGRRIWACLATLLVLLANYKGASLVLLIYNTWHPVPNLYDIFDARLANDIGDGWNDPNRHNPFGWIFTYPPPTLRLFPPAYDIYFPEFHANIGGDFMTLASLLMASATFKVERSNWPWICLLIFPVMTIITATWFIIVVAVLCAGCLAVALLAGKRPESWRVVGAGTGVALLLIWPSVNSLLSGTYPVDIHLTPWVEYTNPYEFIIQWWPAIIPWLCLFFIWNRMSLLARWIHAALPLLLIFFEVVTIADRGLTVEKNWGAIYGAGLVVFLPLVFVERNGFFRLVTVLFLFISTIFFGVYAKICYDDSWGPDVLRLRGDITLQIDPQKKRLEQVLERFHGVTVIAGKSVYAYNEAPSLVGFSENMCYIAWFYQEDQCGHGGEAQFRDKQVNDFFAGNMPDPLGFLRSNDIAAVMIWPEDTIPDNILQQLRTHLGSDYYYIDCKGDGPNNAGVFVRLPGAPVYGTNLALPTYPTTPVAPTPATPAPAPAPASAK